MNDGRIKVAVFDSGIGGLNVLSACVKRLPSAGFCYAADNFNVPYGTKSKEELLKLVYSVMDKVAVQNPSVAVIACNTATANCIGELRSRYGFPIVGMQPAVKQGCKISGECLVLATPSTVGSTSFKTLVHNCGAETAIIHPCEGLASYIEENVFDLPERVPEGLLPQAQPSSVVLGCTHYIFIERQIKSKYNCPVYDGVEGTVNRVCQILGIGNHFEDKLGIFDHFKDLERKITFIGGNNVKNEMIFKKLCEFKT